MISAKICGKTNVFPSRSFGSEKYPKRFAYALAVRAAFVVAHLFQAHSDRGFAQPACSL
jgi:hypothetical protein